MTFLIVNKKMVWAGRLISLNVGATSSGAPSSPLVVTLEDMKSGHTLADPVFQRKAGSWSDADAGWADTAVLFATTGEVPANPQARVVSAIDGTVIKNWTTLRAVTTTSGTSAMGYLDAVPAGGDYLLQVRSGGEGSPVSNGIQRWGVGVCVLAMGQSNMVNMMSAGSYTDIPPGSTQDEVKYFQNNRPGAFFGTSGWASTGGTNGTGVTSVGGNVNISTGGALSFLRITGKALSTKYGRKIPVCLIPWAFNGNSISAFLPGGGNYNTLFNNSGTAAGSIGFKSPLNYWGGDIEGVVWHQGEADQAGGRAAYLQNLKDLYTGLLAYVAPFGRTAADLFFLPGLLGVYANLATIENIRGAGLDFDAYARTNNWPRARIGWNCIDLDPSDGGDGLHFIDVAGGNQYRRWHVKRMTEAVLHQLRCAPAPTRGPRISGAVRGANNTVTLSVEHDGGTALALRNPGSAATGWSASNNGAAVAVTTVEITGVNTIKLTMAGAFTHVGYMRGMYPSVTNPVYDNRSYPTGCTGIDVFVGLPLLPTPDLIEVV